MHIAQYLPKLISWQDNRNFIQLPSEEVVRKAVFFINKNKALGSDGYSAKFFQEFWPLIKMLRNLLLSFSGTTSWI